MLLDARDVRLDGVPVVMSDEMLLPRATVRDVGGPTGRSRCGIERDPRVIDVPSPGVGLTADGTLARLGETTETGCLAGAPAQGRRATARRRWAS